MIRMTMELTAKIKKLGPQGHASLWVFIWGRGSIGHNLHLYFKKYSVVLPNNGQTTNCKCIMWMSIGPTLLKL